MFVCAVFLTANDQEINKIPTYINSCESWPVNYISATEINMLGYYVQAKPVLIRHLLLCSDNHMA